MSKISKLFSWIWVPFFAALAGYSAWSGTDKPRQVNLSNPFGFLYSLSPRVDEYPEGMTMWDEWQVKQAKKQGLIIKAYYFRQSPELVLARLQEKLNSPEWRIETDSLSSTFVHSKTRQVLIFHDDIEFIPERAPEGTQCYVVTAWRARAIQGPNSELLPIE